MKEWAGASFTTLALVFTDVVGSTDLYTDLGNEESDRIRRIHFQHARSLIKIHNGYEIKTIGDSFMVAFRTAVEALNFALHFYTNTGHERLKIRAGIHVGSVHIDENDAFGLMVNYTGRVLKEASGGPEIWISDRAKGDVEDEKALKHNQLEWDEHPDCVLKGFHGTHKLWSLRIEGLNFDFVCAKSMGEESKTLIDPETYDISLYYLPPDDGKVEEFAELLEEKFGFAVWFDIWCVPPGLPSKDEFILSLDKSDSCAIFINGRTSVIWLKEAIEIATNWQKFYPSRRVLPIILEDAIIDINEVPELQGCSIDFRPKTDKEFSYHKLKCGVKGIPIGKWPKNLNLFPDKENIIIDKSAKSIGNGLMQSVVSRKNPEARQANDVQ